jgi:hypothetical protein
MSNHTPTPWIACHDTLVCMGAKQIQKWCVREGDKNGPLIAVMLTKEVAHLLAASREMRDSLLIWKEFFDSMPKGQFARISCDIGLMNDGFITMKSSLAKAGAA